MIIDGSVQKPVYKAKAVSDVPLIMGVGVWGFYYRRVPGHGIRGDLMRLGMSLPVFRD